MTIIKRRCIIIKIRVETRRILDEINTEKIFISANTKENDFMKTFLRGSARTICIFLTFLMICGAFASFSAAAAETDSDVYESVLLVDVSESMNRSDPEENGVRLSIEAMRAFAYNRPADCDFFVSIVAYSTEGTKVTTMHWSNRGVPRTTQMISFIK